ncbi:hypothetical protein WICPIJ_005145 [Wickerhamomyces pijperi]|uniref:PUM-HD domain-containing protein n=1 Tax=Wickerhamomyces pijperi TaxID=599730 RepID=A0A9P8TM80_WICPI|nr:hypothetical protein WICPIJ_005145 [Wickerhamomyces pijperi]
MNHSQDLNSFLSVQEVPSLTPQRSLSPNYNNDTSFQQAASGGLGSFRRARAGTLPSRLYSSANPLVPQASSSSSGSTSSSVAHQNNLAAVSSSSALDPSSLNFDSLSISSNLGSNSLELPQTKTRLRSGSLLGLSESNSIWGMDSASNSNSNTSHSQPSSSTLLPTSGSLEAPLPLPLPLPSVTLNGASASSSSTLSDPLFSGNRVRAYSTNNLANNEQNGNYMLQNYLANDSIINSGSLHRDVVIHNTSGLPTANNDISMSTLRPRAQTIQNGANDTIMTSLYSLQNHSISELPEQSSSVQFPQSSTLLPPQQQHHHHHHLNLSQPLLLDNIDSRLLNWTSTYLDSNLGPTNTIYISKLPSQQITPFALASVLVKFGNVRTVRLFIGNEAALVEYDNIAMAMQAKVQLNHQELLPGYPCLVTFAKILPSESHSDVSSSSASVPQQIQVNGEVQEFVNPANSTSGTSVSSAPTAAATAATSTTAPTSTNDYGSIVQEQPLQLPDLVDDIYDAVQKLGIPRDSGQVNTIIRNALRYQGFDTDFGPLPDPILVKEYDAPKLRETRKAIEANTMSYLEIEELSLAMLDELPELASDYLGNTVVQKLFEFSSDSIKATMLKEVSPYLAQMGIHKNGTWSAQKMINVANSPLQKNIVATSLRPYCVPLLNDQYGNYVIQCSLKFGSPWNDFIFEAILAKFWLIVQNRFGARAIRACLESHEATPQQTAIVSAAIILHARYIAVNQNSALLITWFLDTCTLPNRYVLLAPRLISHLGTLCTHKLASLTILKILNNRYEIEARNMIFNALFGNVTSISISNVSDLPPPPDVLSEILQDPAHGVSFVQKVVSNSQLEGEIRKNIIAQVRRVLLDLNVGSYQGYKRLLEEVGLNISANSSLSASASSSNGRGHQRSHSSSNSGNGARNKNRNATGNASNNKQQGFNGHARNFSDFRGEPQQNQQFVSSSTATPEYDYNQQQRSSQIYGNPGNINQQQQHYYESNNNNFQIPPPQQSIYDQSYFQQMNQQQYMQPQQFYNQHEQNYNTRPMTMMNGFNGNANGNGNGMMMPPPQQYFAHNNGLQVPAHNYSPYGAGN